MVISVKHLQDAVAPGFALYKRYQPHIAAASMLVGFGIDNYSFGRIDRPGANIVLTAYLLVAAGSIVFAHYLEARADRIKSRLAKAAFISGPRQSPLDASKLQFKSVPQSEAAPATTVEGLTAAFEKTEETAKSKDPTDSRLRALLPAATQFALGSLWSGFLVFYSRSAVLAASWPFMLLLLAFFVGNETFKKYHSRLVFSSLLLFFAI